MPTLRTALGHATALVGLLLTTALVGAAPPDDGARIATPAQERPTAETERQATSPMADPTQATALPDSGTSGVPGSELRVWLVTAGPGDAVWERYGHNALRVLDTRTGRDVSYNWGIFDFQQVDFIPRFLQGRMLYMMAPFSTPAMIDAYARANREVVLQELDLTDAQKLELQNLAEVNALPENRDYIYQYFLDNCSTRVRDLLDRVLGGALRTRFAEEPTGTTYRFHTRRLTQVDPLIYTGMDLLLGAPTDATLSVWEEMFLPLTLRDEIRDVDVRRADGSTVPLVRSEEVVVPSTRPPEAQAPPAWLPFYVVAGLVLAGLFALLGSPLLEDRVVPRRIILGLAVVWTALGGVAGTILLLLLVTDHTFAYWNENLFLVHPLLLGFVALLPLLGRGPAWRRRARILASIVVGVAVAGLLWQATPWSWHRNAIFFALLLPPQLGLWWALRPVAQGSAVAPPDPEIDPR